MMKFSLEEFKKMDAKERENALYLMSPISFDVNEFRKFLHWHMLMQFADIYNDLEEKI